MAYRKLISLPLDEELKANLSDTSFNTVKDVLVQPPLMVMNELQLSADQCKEFMDYLFSLCLPPKLMAYEMEEKEELNSIALGSRGLDTFLRGGLLPGSITEFVGPPGIGKTQWCLDITAKVVTKGRAEGATPSAIYIDTESAVRPERVVEMLMSKYPEHSSEIPQFLSRIHVFRPKTASCMIEILDSLEFVVVEKDARVVIVDSITSVAVLLSEGSARLKASQLAFWATKLKSLAHQLNICVIVTNQVMAGLEPVPPEPPSAVKPWTYTEDQVPHVTDYLSDEEDSGSEVRELVPLPGNIDPPAAAAAVPSSNQVPSEVEQVSHKKDNGSELREFVPLPGDHEESEGRSECFVPALGVTWTHCITTRFILQHTESSARQIVIAKSPVSPFAAFYYTITKDGITVKDEDSYFSYSAPDLSQFRIRVDEGIPSDPP